MSRLQLCSLVDVLFPCQVLLEFSPSTAIPGEKNTLQVSAMPGSLCGVSAIDQSVHIKEPGKRLDADKVRLSSSLASSSLVGPLFGYDTVPHFILCKKGYIELQ